MKRKKIIILGGGIGGLTVAHELVQANATLYDINLYERNKTIGGMARSGYKKRTDTLLPTEYCWRIYGPNYRNLRAILKQIPLQNDPTKKVHDNLVDIRNYLIADQGKLLQMNNRPKTLWDIRDAFKQVPPREKMHVLSRIIYGFLISTERLNSLDAMTWSDYVNPRGKLSHDMRKYVVDIMGPYLGAEPSRVNVPSVIKTLETFKLFNRPISVMNGPTNEAWFDHWQTYLESKGVTFHLETSVEKVETSGDMVTGVVLQNGTTVTGDHYVCGLPVESVARFTSLGLPDVTTLAKRARQRMVGIQLYFDKKIALPHRNTAMYIPDSPWQLVIEPQGSIWNKQYGDVADIWSGGLCDPLRPGLLVKKPFVQCSHSEIRSEVWHQLRKSVLGKTLGLANVKLLDHNVWHTYVYDGKTLDTIEPKFSTNKDTYFLRPGNQTTYKNFYFATAYTKTKTDMFEMEGAAESGRRAASLIEPSVRVAESYRPLFFAPFRLLDRMFGRANLYKQLPLLWGLLLFPIALAVYPLGLAVGVIRARTHA